MTEEREAIHRRAIERERENRWNAKGRACVTHPKYGSVVVPHSSNLAALMNAAEYWDCDWSEITALITNDHADKEGIAEVAKYTSVITC